MKVLSFLISLLVILSSCNKNTVNCIDLENELNEHPHIDDLDIYLSGSETGDDFIENCYSYYDQVKNIIDKGCLSDLNSDSISVYRKSVCDAHIGGLWTISYSKRYKNSDCTGPYSNLVDSVAWKYGSRMKIYLELKKDKFIQKIIGSYSGNELCSMGLGTIDGDSCYTFIGGISVDSLCTIGGGSYSAVSDSCNYDILISSEDYLIDGYEIIISSSSGTDYVEEFIGSWSIVNGDYLNITASNSASCIKISASR